jgi:nucleotide-binding universal stress UspA family protein
MTKEILIATDLTARGDRPFQRAKMLADQWQANRSVLFVNDSKSDVEKSKVQDLLNRNYREDAEGCSLVISKGSPPKIIAHTAAAEESDLIVVGAARHNNLSDFFLGTAVDHLIHHATTPVLVVKERPFGHYKNIVVAVDFSDFSANALLTALKLFPGANIQLVHAYHVAYEAWLNSDGVVEEMHAEAKKEMRHFMESLDLPEADRDRVSLQLVEGNLHQSIYRILDTGDVDLLVLGTHGHSGFVKATIGSRASEMLKWSPVDVLMVGKPEQ